MTEGLKRVEQEAQEFRDKVEQCRDKPWQILKDAYSRLHRLRPLSNTKRTKCLALTPVKKKPFARFLKTIRSLREWARFEELANTSKFFAAFSSGLHVNEDARCEQDGAHQ
jgi:hypothetical protein